MHYLITGHTGFKGAWLALWLAEAGHQVSGISLDPDDGALFTRAHVDELMTTDIRADIRDASAVQSALDHTHPDVVVHMAAQPLVRESYRDPRWTIETNVMGTLNVLQAVKAADSVKAQLIVTTDKVYRNINQIAGYVERDPLGGEDPYSASKAMADILTHSWVTSFGGPPTAVARAGNVIGGGDVSKDRLLPDLLEAVAVGRSPVLRYPRAVRPWQHVLDCLNGYRMLIDHMLCANEDRTDWGSWNFGPGPENFVTVGEVANRVGEMWGAEGRWSETEPDLHEAGLLALDATKARTELKWSDRLSLDQALEWTVEWSRGVQQGDAPRGVSIAQINAFSRDSAEAL